VRTIDAKVSCSVPVAAAFVEGVYVKETDVTPDAVVPELEVTEPDVEDTPHAVPEVIAVSVFAVMLVAEPTVKSGPEKLTVVGNLYPCIAHDTRARVCAMTSVSVVDPVGPV
jgi:hypothetical protein